MAKPPSSPPHSDIDGVHRDGTGPGKPLPVDGDDAGDLEEARQENAGRPHYDGEKTRDDRAG